MSPTTTETTTDSVSAYIDVDAPVAHVFETFTSRMDTWWDPTHHLLENTVEMRVDPRPGGGITDVAADGTTCTWARVLAYEPPTRFVFSWDINLQWEVETDHDRCSEVEVTFTALSEDRTHVQLVHRHLQRHGEGWESMGRAVGAADGWSSNLVRMASALTR